MVTTARFAALRDRIETRLSRLGIQGNIRRVTVLHPMRSAITDSARARATTLAIVGTDDSIVRSLDILAATGLPIGIIPVGNPAENCIAQALGIPMGELACDVLARRRILPLDLGQAGAQLFLRSAVVRADRIVCTGANGAFRISSIARDVELTIVNLSCTVATDTAAPRISPCDGYLDLHIQKKKKAMDRLFFRSEERASSLPLQRVTITEPSGGRLLLDGVRSVTLPTTVTIAPTQLRCIVGRRLSFADPLMDDDAPTPKPRLRKNNTRPVHS
jgi:diacylglycerol kinase family enzyme